MTNSESRPAAEELHRVVVQTDARVVDLATRALRALRDGESGCVLAQLLLRQLIEASEAGAVDAAEIADTADCLWFTSGAARSADEAARLPA